MVERPLLKLLVGKRKSMDLTESRASLPIDPLPVTPTLETGSKVESVTALVQR